MSKKWKPADEIVAMTPEDKAAVQKVLVSAADVPNPSLSRGEYADVWLLANRLAGERRVSSRLTWATIGIAGATLLLAIATVVLAWITAVHHDSDSKAPVPVTVHVDMPAVPAPPGVPAPIVPPGRPQ